MCSLSISLYTLLLVIVLLFTAYMANKDIHI